MGIEKRLIQNNFTKGRNGYSVKRIILHTYAGGGRSLYNWFNNPSTQASAHFAIFKDGNGEQYVEEGDWAWHAGTVAEGGNPNNNWESIGIEHQDDGNWQDGVRTKELYEASARLVADLCRRHNIPCRLLTPEQKWEAGIAPHNYYAQKGCPGGLDLARIVNRAKELLNPEPSWKKGWKPKTEKFQPKKTYSLYNITNGQRIESYDASKEPTTHYEKDDWRMTEFSYSKNIPNAFKLSELTWKPEPIPEPIPEPEPEPQPIDKFIVEVGDIDGANIPTKQEFNNDFEARVIFEEEKKRLKEGHMVTLYKNSNIIDYFSKPMEQPTPVEPVPPTEVDPNTGKPHNKFLERKFLIAIIAPVVSVALNKVGLTDYLNEYVNYVVDTILWGAPVLWIWIEGRLDQEKIKQAGEAKVAELQNSVS